MLSNKVIFESVHSLALQPYCKVLTQSIGFAWPDCGAQSMTGQRQLCMAQACQYMLCQNILAPFPDGLN